MTCKIHTSKNDVRSLSCFAKSILIPHFFTTKIKNGHLFKISSRRCSCASRASFPFATLTCIFVLLYKSASTPRWTPNPTRTCLNSTNTRTSMSKRSLLVFISTHAPQAFPSKVWGNMLPLLRINVWVQYFNAMCIPLKHFEYSFWVCTNVVPVTC